MYYVVYSNQLSHYGVKGMRWGHRKDPESSGTRRNKASSFKKLGKKSAKSIVKVKKTSGYQKTLADKYKKQYQMTDAEAEAAAKETARRVRNTAIGVAAVTGIAVGTVIAVRYGRMYGDDVIKAGDVMQTLHHNKDIINTGKFYTTTRKRDKLKYIGGFGADYQGIKTRITAETSKDIKSIGVKKATKLYNNLVENNKEFADSVKNVFGDEIEYKRFNHMGLLGDGSNAGIRDAKKAQKIFYSEVKKLGYGAIADWNDRINSKYDTYANIVFDTSTIKNVKRYNDITMRDIVKNKKMLVGRAKFNTYVATNTNLAITAASLSLGSASVARSRRDAELSKRYKKRTTKKNRYQANMLQ